MKYPINGKQYLSNGMPNHSNCIRYQSIFMQHYTIWQGNINL